MKHKHKFYIVNKLMNDETNELAICSDEMTANFLADHYRNVYEGNANGLEVVYKHGRYKKTIVTASYGL